MDTQRIVASDYHASCAVCMYTDQSFSRSRTETVGNCERTVNGGTNTTRQDDEEILNFYFLSKNF